MAYLKSLPEKSHLADVFRAFPAGVTQLLEFHDIILREDSVLSIGERELIAAFVSGLNGCQFCFGSHVRIASLYNIEESVFLELIADIDSAKIDKKLVPILKYVKKLTLTPSKIIQEDIDDILKAGWPEEAIHISATVCALFNFMNRIVDGLGVSAETVSKSKSKPDNLSSKSSYRDFGQKIGLT